MKIVQAVRYFKPVIGGVENYVLNLSNRLAEMGHEVSIVTMKVDGARDYESLEGIQVYRTSVPHLVEEVVSHKPDIVHAHQYRLYHADLAIIASRLCHAPSVLTLHGVYPPSDFARAMYYSAHSVTLSPLTLRLVGRIIFLTHDEENRILALGADRDKLAKIPNAINLEEFMSDASQNTGDEFRDKYEIRDQMILYVGHLAWNKQIDLLIKMMPGILKKFPKAKLVILGEDWGMEKQLKNLALDLKVDSSVVFTGLVSRSELIRAYSACDLFAFPSAYEGMPTVVLEAMASGKAVVAAKGGGTRFLVQHNKTGLLAEVNDLAQMQEYVVQLLEDPALKDQLASNARSYVQKTHGWDNVSSQIEFLYKELYASNNC